MNGKIFEEITKLRYRLGGTSVEDTLEIMNILDKTLMLLAEVADTVCDHLEKEEVKQ